MKIRELLFREFADCEVNILPDDVRIESDSVPCARMSIVIGNDDVPFHSRGILKFQIFSKSGDGYAASEAIAEKLVSQLLYKTLPDENNSLQFLSYSTQTHGEDPQNPSLSMFELILNFNFFGEP